MIPGNFLKNCGLRTLNDNCFFSSEISSGRINAIILSKSHVSPQGGISLTYLQTNIDICICISHLELSVVSKDSWVFTGMDSAEIIVR